MKTGQDFRSPQELIETLQSIKEQVQKIRNVGPGDDYHRCKDGTKCFLYDFTPSQVDELREIFGVKVCTECGGWSHNCPEKCF